MVLSILLGQNGVLGGLKMNDGTTGLLGQGTVSVGGAEYYCVAIWSPRLGRLVTFRASPGSCALTIRNSRLFPGRD